MKPIWMFVLGALLAGAVMYQVTKPSAPAPVSQPVAVNEAPQPAPVPPPTPVDQPVPAPEPVAAAPARRAAEPYPELTERAKKAPGKRAAKQDPVIARNDPPPSTPAPAAKTPDAPARPGDPLPTSVPGPVLPGPPPDKPLVEERKPEPRVAKTVTIPAGTLLSVRVDERLSSETNHSGDSFRATLDQPLVVEGFVIAERGSRVEGRIVEADPGGRVRGLAKMSLELVRLTTSDGQKVRLQTESFARQAEQSRKKDAAKVAAGAGIGAAIGAIAGGGKGAAIGAAIGGASGAGGVMATRGEAAEIAPETRVSFRLREAVTVTEKLN